MRKTITKAIYGTITFIAVIVIIYLIFYLGKETQRTKIIETAKIEEIDSNLKLGIAQYDTINPIESQNKQVQYIDKIIYESLVEVTQEFKLNYLLAKEITKINETSYIIILKENLYFQNGQPLTTSDIENTIYQIQKSDKSIYKTNINNIATTCIIDNSTIRINLKEPEDFFEYNLIFPIIAKEENIGTGKYKIQSISNQIELIFNENYREKLDPNFKTITINLYSEFSQIYTAFKNNEIDTFCTSQQDYQKVLGTKEYLIKEYQGREFNYLLINIEEKEIRKAINYAINKQEITEKIYNSYKVMEYPIIQTSWLYSLKSIYEYNQDKAIETLEKAGWKYEKERWIKNGQELIINFSIKNGNEKQKKVAQNIQKDLEKIGIQLQITEIQKEFYEKYIEKSQYNIILVGRRIGISPNLEYYFNQGSYKNEQIMLLLNQAKETKQERYIIEIYKKIEEYYTQNVPFIGINFSIDTFIYSKKLCGNIEPNWYNIYYNIETWKILKN